MVISLGKGCHVETAYNPYGAFTGVALLDYLNICKYGGYVNIKLQLRHLDLGVPFQVHLHREYQEDHQKCRFNLLL